jgi:tRNA (cytidine/uridine-2'-O-)-methyltransferase
MFHVVLFQPEIPPNTGNIIRLCANTGCGLHLVKPLGFELERREVRRAGLDYDELAEVKVHAGLDACWAELGVAHARTLGQEQMAPPQPRLVGLGAVPARVFAVETGGTRVYSDVAYRQGDVFLFGPETRGLPEGVLARIPAEQRVSVPMRPGNRSINLSNTVALVVYEAWRQCGFAGG